VFKTAVPGTSIAARHVLPARTAGGSAVAGGPTIRNNATHHAPAAAVRTARKLVVPPQSDRADAHPLPERQRLVDVAPPIAERGRIRIAAGTEMADMHAALN
jgi:hypothetical protein